jgi:hypothetical protein
MKYKPLVAGVQSFVAAIIAGAILGSSTHGLAQAGPLRLHDSNNQLVEPLQISGDTPATVFLFISSDCPISNRYAPEYRRLYEAFEARGVRFWLVYPNPADSPEIVRGHLHAFAYPMRALRDPEHLLVKRAKVTVTPEAAVFDKHGQLTYRGRIDDRYASIGLERPAATQHDLYDALKNTIAGDLVIRPITQAVGCFIADFRK